MQVQAYAQSEKQKILQNFFVFPILTKNLGSPTMILLTNTATIITGWWVLPATGNGGRQWHMASEWLKR